MLIDGFDGAPLPGGPARVGFVVRDLGHPQVWATYCGGLIAAYTWVGRPGLIPAAAARETGPAVAVFAVGIGGEVVGGVRVRPGPAFDVNELWGLWVGPRARVRGGEIVRAALAVSAARAARTVGLGSADPLGPGRLAGMRPTGVCPAEAPDGLTLLVADGRRGKARPARDVELRVHA